MELRANANLLKFLERHSHAELDAIRKADPENYDLLWAKAVFDSTRPATISLDTPLAPATRATLQRLVSEYSAKASPEATRLLATVNRRLRLRQWAQMFGGAVAAVSGAALALMPTLGYDKSVVAAWSAATSSAGGLLTLAVGALERNPNGLRQTAVDYQQLAAYQIELAGIQRRLDADEALPLADVELVKLYNRSVEIADEIAKLAM